MRFSFTISINSLMVSVYEQKMPLQIGGGLTKRAVDVWDSARFSSSFLASSFFCSRTFSTPAHPLMQIVEMLYHEAKQKQNSG